MRREQYWTLPFGEIPAVLYGEAAPGLWLYLHGKCGRKEEGAAFAEIVCPKGWQVLAIDLPEHGARRDSAERFVPWDVVPELEPLLDYARRGWDRVALRAVSLGAWFSLQAFAGKRLERARFVSPILDMERLIRDMMGWAGVTEERLETEGEIPTAFGETLSWRYLQYAVRHPVVNWDVPTAILYADGDHLTGRETVDEFVRRFDCELTVMEQGEHWFHTPEQLTVLRAWEKEHT